MGLLETLIVSATTAAITAQLSIGKFKKEKALDKRAEAFSHLTEVATRGMRYAEAYIEHHESQGEGINKRELENIEKNFNEAKNKASKVLYDHYLYMNQKEQDVINNLFIRSEINTDDLVEHASNESKRYDKLIGEIQEQAKKSLGVNQSNIYIALSSIAAQLDAFVGWVMSILSRIIVWLSNLISRKKHT